MPARITIRPLTDDDYALVATWLNDPEINRWLYAEWRNHVVDEKIIAFISKGSKNQLWLSLYDDKPYGLISVGNISSVDRSGVAWYFRGSNVERQAGVMSQSVLLAMKDAFQNLNLHSISASIQVDNIASEKLLLKIGFQKVGTMREAFFVNNQFVDRVEFDLLKQDISLD